jgi:hypothetical protein
MRVSIWKQDRKRQRWRRLGVVIIDAAGALPFKSIIPYGDTPLWPHWPRLCWYSMERHDWDLFDRERRPDDAEFTNGNS